MIVGLSSKSTQIDLTSQPANQPLSSQYHTNWPQRTTQYQEIGRKYCKTTHSLFSVELTRNWLNGHNITQDLSSGQPNLWKLVANMFQLLWHWRMIIYVKWSHSSHFLGSFAKSGLAWSGLIGHFAALHCPLMNLKCQSSFRKSSVNGFVSR